MWILCRPVVPTSKEEGGPLWKERGFPIKQCSNMLDHHLLGTQVHRSLPRQVIIPVSKVQNMEGKEGGGRHQVAVLTLIARRNHNSGELGVVSDGITSRGGAVRRGLGSGVRSVGIRPAGLCISSNRAPNDWNRIKQQVWVSCQ